MPSLGNNFSFYKSSFTEEKDLAAGKSSNHFVQICINYLALAHNEMCIVLWDYVFASICFSCRGYTELNMTWNDHESVSK
jgi:hypothetical protein